MAVRPQRRSPVPARVLSRPKSPGCRHRSAPRSRTRSLPTTRATRRRGLEALMPAEDVAATAFDAERRRIQLDLRVVQGPQRGPGAGALAAPTFVDTDPIRRATLKTGLL